MALRIHTFTNTVTDSRGTRYRVHVEGVHAPDGTWQGWLVFEPETGDGESIRTDRETTQPEREDLEYWASGLEAVYLDGALTRATRSTD